VEVAPELVWGGALCLSVVGEFGGEERLDETERRLVRTGVRTAEGGCDFELPEVADNGCRESVIWCTFLFPFMSFISGLCV
jgi:hypothetical protein